MPLVLPAELHRDIDGIVADYELTTLIERLLPVIKLILITEAAQPEISKVQNRPAIPITVEMRYTRGVLKGKK